MEKPILFLYILKQNHLKNIIVKNVKQILTKFLGILIQFFK